MRRAKNQIAVAVYRGCGKAGEFNVSVRRAISVGMVLRKADQRLPRGFRGAPDQLASAVGLILSDGSGGV